VKEILTIKTFKGFKKQVACGTANKLTGIKSEDYTESMVKAPWIDFHNSAELYIPIFPHHL
jgi:hypothetical protein